MYQQEKSDREHEGQS